MLLFIGLMIAMSLFAETGGIFFRLLGALNNQPTFGYSVHVRFATVGRFFVFFAAPALGFIVDIQNSAKSIAIIGFTAFLIHFLLCVFITLTRVDVFNRLYKKLSKNNKSNSVEFQNIKIFVRPLNKSFYALSSLAFFTTSIGLLIVNLLATIFVDFKATIIQSSAIITSLGTVIHIFFIDPKLAISGDNDVTLLYSLVCDFLNARMLISLVLSLIFLLLYCFCLN